MGREPGDHLFVMEGRREVRGAEDSRLRGNLNLESFCVSSLFFCLKLPIALIFVAAIHDAGIKRYDE